jgi:hypothetical protein
MDKKVILFVLTLLFALPLEGATIYKWVDEKGVTNFADDPDKVPPAYRDQVLKEQMEDVQKATPPPTVQQPLPQNEERDTDVYGRGEVWWRERVRPLKEKLREATENYENARQKFLKKAEEIGQTNFYGRSRSQSKWDAMELNRLREEEKKYEDQLAEAKENLKGLIKEAEEAKANPEWLN